MFRDPSGLAPEGEKNNKVQAPGDDYIGSSHTNGYWAESTHKVWNGRMSLVNPLDPSTHKIYEEDFVWEWVPGSSGGGAGGSGAASSPSDTWGKHNVKGSISRRKYIDPNSLRSKSVRDQDAVNDNTRVQKEPQLQNLDNLLDKLQIAQASDRIDRLNEQFVDDYVKNPLTVSGVYLGIREYGLERNGQWLGKNGQWVSLDRVTGNQYLGSRTQVTNLASKFRLAGKTIGGISMSISFYEGINAGLSGDYMSAGKSSADILFTYLSFTGPVGFTVSGIYFVIDMSGGFDGNVYHSYNPYKNSFIQDNTQLIRSGWEK